MRMLVKARSKQQQQQPTPADSKTVEASLSLLMTGILAVYGTVLLSQLIPRLKVLKAGKPLPPPYMDAVTYLTDAVPVIKIPRSVAERAVHRLIKSNYFKQQTSGLDPAVQRSFIQRLKARMSGMPNKLSDAETAEVNRWIDAKKYG
jgi:hypothetical protein